MTVIVPWLTISQPQLGTRLQYDFGSSVPNPGFPYDYVTSRELYIGSAHFTRVRLPQTGDLVVWRGHACIVIDSKRHSFFSFVTSGPDTQFYDSAYWRSRGLARFFRYLKKEPLPARRTVQAEGHPNL